ncbi:sugar-phosphatase [Desemzia sp. RIT804]|uniref:sugar-phosphatase n=1 Tax=Desemzia sp. RIT 804 TaxID=2810209 RepID=UPI0019528BE2|nr:sugar-phosphatase [Desemzia sp. RIT 804]
MKISLIALDLDGTLLLPDRTVSPKVAETLAIARSKGIKLVLCSGRPLPGVLPLLEELDLQNEGDHVITYNGALVQQSNDGKILSHHTMDYEDFLEVDKLGREIGLHCHAVNDKGVYTTNKDISYYSVRESFLTTVPLRYRTAEEMDPTLLISKMMFVDPKEILEEAIPKIPTAFAEKYTLLRSEDFFLEVLNKSASKGQALRDLAAILNIPREEIMAIGDNGNDLDMLEFAGMGVAMDNASLAAKEASDYVTDSNAHDGVATAIEKFAF